MLTNLELLKLRAYAANNDRQHDRIVIDKKRSMHRALLYSYQTAWVKKDNDDEAEWVRALMNPDRVKFDYDEKIISIDWEYGYEPGDTFEWGKDTGSHWIILKPELTELAYFRANCRRCQELTAVDPETKETFSQWVAVRGPVETKINTIQKAGIVADVPNLTLDIYMADTEQNRRTFTRYSRFQFSDRFWKVTAPDLISTPGVIEIQAQEDYECLDDPMFDVPEQKEDLPDYINEIIGDSSIKPMQSKLYRPKFVDPIAQWSITLPAERNKEIDDVLEYKEIDDYFQVRWLSSRSGQFIIHYGNIEKTVNVESLF